MEAVLPLSQTGWHHLHPRTHEVVRTNIIYEDQDVRSGLVWSGLVWSGLVWSGLMEPLDSEFSRLTVE